MNTTSFGDIVKDIKPRKRTTKARCPHQEMMGMVKAEGWAVGRWVGAWAKLIKQSGINFFDLRRIIEKSKTLQDYSPRGFVRNRLQKKDWVKHFD